MARGVFIYKEKEETMPSQKVLDEKKKVVEGLSRELKKAQAIVITDYRGLTVDQDTVMRAALRKGGVTYRVVKNTLSGLAMKDAGIRGADDLLKGPTAFAYSAQDVVSAAKIIKEYADKFEKLTIKGGVLEGKVITTDEVNRLAKIPGKEVLYSQIVFGLMAPIANLTRMLQAVLEQREKVAAEAPNAMPAEAAAE
jgi:large subunit ribosomal protein L10